MLWLRKLLGLVSPPKHTRAAFADYQGLEKSLDLVQREGLPVRQIMAVAIAEGIHLIDIPEQPVTEDGMGDLLRLRHVFGQFSPEAAQAAQMRLAFRCEELSKLRGSELSFLGMTVLAVWFKHSWLAANTDNPMQAGECGMVLRKVEENLSEIFKAPSID